MDNALYLQQAQMNSMDLLDSQYHDSANSSQESFKFVLDEMLNMK